MVRRPFDAYFKSLVESCASEIIRFLFPEVKVSVLSTKLDKELIAIKTRVADQVLHVRSTHESLFHFEYMSSYDPDIAHDVFIKAALLDNKYGLEVTSVLLQLKPPPKGRNLAEYRVYLGAEPTNCFRYNVVALWKWYEVILAGTEAYLIFVPLLTAIVPRVDKNLLRRQRELLALIKDKKLYTKLLYFTIAFAKKYFSEKFLQNFFMENLKMADPMEEVPYFGKQIREKRLQAMAEGKAEGKAEGLQLGTTSTLRKSIIELLRNRFGGNGHRNGVNGKITRLVNAIAEPRKLETIFRRALTAKSLEKALAILEKAQSSAKRSSTKAQSLNE